MNPGSDGIRTKPLWWSRRFLVQFCVSSRTHHLSIWEPRSGMPASSLPNGSKRGGADLLNYTFTQNIRKGDFSRAKVRGKRAIELGAGMGLAGMAFAMVGADVVLTDTADVLGLLRINYENNLSPAAVRLARAHQHGTWADSAGSVAVAELDWTKPEQVRAPPLNPPYDFVLAADCIYHETLTEHFHRTVMDVTNEKSTVVVCNELRSHSVQGRFMDLFTATHTIKSIAHTKMDDTYQHPNIFIYIMKKKKKLSSNGKGGGGGGG
ncbi:hypothetical protein Vretimale_9693, partial [Volvox reticuliferus]